MANQNCCTNATRIVVTSEVSLIQDAQCSSNVNTIQEEGHYHQFLKRKPWDCGQRHQQLHSSCRGSTAWRANSQNHAHAQWKIQSLHVDVEGKGVGAVKEVVAGVEVDQEQDAD